MDSGYPEFGYHLNRTGKSMIYSCSWPVYQIYAGMAPNYTSIIDNCNLWRNFDDIQDSWASVESIIDYYGNNQDIIVPNAGPGHWNDPDMVSELLFFSHKYNHARVIIHKHERFINFRIYRKLISLSFRDTVLLLFRVYRTKFTLTRLRISWFYLILTCPNLCAHNCVNNENFSLKKKENY